LVPALVFGGVALASILLHLRLYAEVSKLLPTLSRRWGMTYPYLELTYLRSRRQIGTPRMTLLAISSLAVPWVALLVAAWIQGRALAG
jgi:hypothetical protein